MRYGITCFLTDVSIRPDDLAVACEERGFDGLYLPEHTHIPTSRATPAPMGEPLPVEYRRTLDPFVALTLAAAATRTLKVGTGICLVAQRDPIVTAKEVATLDHLSGGRFDLFGVGFGWNREELTDHGVSYAERRAVVRERVLAMKALWTDDEAGFDGRHVRFEKSWAWPKPAHPIPVWLGGQGGPKLFAHVAEWADGWMPIGGRGIAAAIPELRAAYERAGRDPADVKVLPFGSIPERGKLDRFASMGIDHVVLTVPTGTRDEVLATLDRYAGIVA